jgi:hypothetical protein
MNFFTGFSIPLSLMLAVFNPVDCMALCTKGSYLSTRLYGVISYVTVILMFIALRTSILIFVKQTISQRSRPAYCHVMECDSRRGLDFLNTCGELTPKKLATANSKKCYQTELARGTELSSAN